jgi:hypothetical protein
MTTTDALDLIDINDIEDGDTVGSPSLQELDLNEYNEAAFLSGIHAYLDWFYDGEQSEFDK